MCLLVHCAANLGSQDAAVPEATRRFRQATRNIVLGLREGQDVEALTERLHRCE